jgi:mRNA interferase YafQ
MSKYIVEQTKSFKREYKICQRWGLDMRRLQAVVDIIAAGETIPAKYHDHELKGDYCGVRELHIAPDWLLFYIIEDDVLILTLTHTGSHSDLFK